MMSEADIDPISHVILITGAFVFGVFGQAVYTTDDVSWKEGWADHLLSTSSMMTPQLTT
jgi:hypothetical protein